jgi:hypothetical protein
MPSQPEQNFSNHSKLDVIHHFVVFPILLLNVLRAASLCATSFSFDSVLQLLVAAALMLLSFKVRLYSLKVQDRLIRLEERLRIAPLLSPDERAEVLGLLSEPQLVGLRFASDGEVANLARRAAREKLTKSDIKKAIVSWRGDYFRV